MPAGESVAEVDERVRRLQREGLIGLSEAAKLFGTYRGGRPTHPATVGRWALHGVRLGDGRLVRLETIRLAGRLGTSRAAVERFLAAQQGAEPMPAGQPVRTPANRRRESAKAERELIKRGC